MPVQPSRSRPEPADGYERLIGIGPQGDGSGVHGKNVICVVHPYQACPCLFPVYLQLHSVETLFHYPACVVCNAPAGVCDDLRLGVLDHDHPVPVEFFRAAEHCYNGIVPVEAPAFAFVVEFQPVGE